MEVSCNFLRNCPPATDSFRFVFTSVRVPGVQAPRTFCCKRLIQKLSCRLLPQATFSTFRRYASSETMALSCPFPAPPTLWAIRPTPSHLATSSTTTWGTCSSQIVRRSVVPSHCPPVPRITTKTAIVTAETSAIAAAAPSGSTITCEPHRTWMAGPTLIRPCCSRSQRQHTWQPTN